MNTVVERIKERLPIIDVLSSYISLQESGSQYKAKCPFHNERTASFSISPDRGLYYCFGCGAKGDIFTFVQEFEGLDFNGALRLLAERAGVPLTKDSFKRDDTAPLYEILEDAAQAYAAALSENKPAKEYLLRRGVTEETIQKFRIGYAPDTWEFLSHRYQGAKQRLAQTTGLLKPGERGLYDRFRARIMFPINDSAGRVVGFSGRMFPDSPDGAKYLNSPDTPLFQKSKLLFGFDKAKFDIKRRNFCILVEGQFDLILLHQAGFTNTVAASGTGLSEDTQEDISNLGIIARLTKNIILAFDGDEAGKKAMDRAARVALTLGMNPKVVVLPSGSDPADFVVANGAAAWKEKLMHSEHVVVFQGKDLVGKGLSPHHFAAGFRERVFPYLRLIPSSVERARQLELVSSAAGVPFSALQEDFSQFLIANPEQSSRPVAPSLQKHQFDTVMLFLGILNWQADSVEPKIDPLQFRKRAEEISFEEETYKIPEVDETTLQAAKLYAANFYAPLSVEELLIVLEDQLQGITASFLYALRSRFTAQLHEAERTNDEERTTLLLGKLHKLSLQLHNLKEI